VAKETAKEELARLKACKDVIEIADKKYAIKPVEWLVFGLVGIILSVAVYQFLAQIGWKK